MREKPERLRAGNSWLPWLVLAGLLIVNLVIGFGVGNQFGASYDEDGDALYGRDAIRAYQGGALAWSAYGGRKYYGPAYLMAQNLVADGLVQVLPGWLPSDARHLVTFLTFQLATIAFFAIARRYVSSWPALAATMLFSMQPLYFGHAFINQKDIPFLAFFLCSVALGWLVVDALERAPKSPGTQRNGGLWSTAKSHFREAWGAMTPRGRTRVIGLAAASAVVFLELFVTRAVVLPVLDNLIRAAYSGRAWDPVNRLFQALAQHSGEIPVDAYIEKANKLYATGSALALFAWLAAIVFAMRRPVSQTLRDQWSLEPKLWPQGWLQNKTTILILVLAGSVMGLTTSIRVFGTFAGLLVSLLVLARAGRRAVVPLVIYWAAAALATYATWPFLWASPIANLVEALRFMANHPWMGYVLYMGELTKGRLLPWHYLPTLITLQFTEPAILLAVAGTLAGLWRSRFRHLPSARWSLLMLWFAAPPVVEIVRHAWLYDNFRQFLFVTPPIFLVAALGLDAALAAVRHRILQWVLVIAVLIPGIIAILRLHPYEYVYYNAFAGGVDRAAGRFELDYWCTSYRQAADYLNSTLPYGARVAVWGPAQIVSDYARPDIAIERYGVEAELRQSQAPFVVICGRANNNVQILAGADILRTFEIQGSPLAVIKRIPSGQ